MAEEEPPIEEEAPGGAQEGRNGAGPGLVVGFVLGALAGAAAATLFAPASRDEMRHRITEEAGPLLKHEEAERGGPATPVERMRAILTRVRSRVQEASEQAGEAAREAEEQSRARYAELTHHH